MTGTYWTFISNLNTTVTCTYSLGFVLPCSSLISCPTAEWVFKNKYGIQQAIHILNDLFIAAQNKLDCLTSFNTLLRVFMSLKAQVVAFKTVGPSWEIDFMGIILDSIHMEAHLPQDKLVGINQLLNSFKNRRLACLITVTDWDSPVFMLSSGTG